MARASSGAAAEENEEEWTEKHRNVARKLVLEGGWVHKRLFDIGGSDESKCQACHKDAGTEKHKHAGTEKHKLYHCLEWHEVRRRIPEAFRKWEQTARASKKEWKWQQRCCNASTQ